MKQRNKYLKIVEWSEQDKYYICSIQGWIKVDYEESYESNCMYKVRTSRCSSVT